MYLHSRSQQGRVAALPARRRSGLPKGGLTGEGQVHTTPTKLVQRTSEASEPARRAALTAILTKTPPKSCSKTQNSLQTPKIVRLDEETTPKSWERRPKRRFWPKIVKIRFYDFWRFLENHQNRAPRFSRNPDQHRKTEDFLTKNREKIRKSCFSVQVWIFDKKPKIFTFCRQLLSKNREKLKVAEKRRQKIVKTPNHRLGEKKSIQKSWKRSKFPQTAQTWSHSFLRLRAIAR